EMSEDRQTVGSRLAGSPGAPPPRVGGDLNRRIDPMWYFDNEPVPQIRTELPGPRARELLDRDARFVSPSYTRVYPLVVERGSGAAALEAALKLARWHTGRSRAIAFFGAFHGRTYGAMSLSGSKLVHRRGFSPLVPDIHHAPYPRGCHGCDSPESACACVAQI